MTSKYQKRDRCDLTIGVPTFRREPILLETLQRIVNLMDPRRMELIIADQQPDYAPGTLEQLRRWEDSGHLVRIVLDRPGVTGARNEIVARSQGEVILFLDDDVMIPETLFERHLRHYTDPAVGAVTGQVYNCLDPHDPPDLDHPDRKTRAEMPPDIPPREFRMLWGGNASIRRDVALAIGGNDENFIGPATHEDLDMGYRVLGAGYDVVNDPEAWLVHLRAPGAGRTDWPQWQRAANLFLMAFRYRRLGRFRHFFVRGLCRDFVRKVTLRHPWRIPAAFCHCVRACHYGWRHAGEARSRLLKNPRKTRLE